MKGGEVGMLTNEVINHMDVEELRNYAATQLDMLDAYGELVFAHDNLIHRWEDLYHAFEHKEDALKSLNVHKGKMAILENALLNEYKEYLQKPVEETTVRKVRKDVVT